MQQEQRRAEAQQREAQNPPAERRGGEAASEDSEPEPIGGHPLMDNVAVIQDRPDLWLQLAMWALETGHPRPGTTVQDEDLQAALGAYPAIVRR
jgi:hypothetical protein